MKPHLYYIYSILSNYNCLHFIFRSTNFYRLITSLIVYVLYCYKKPQAKQMRSRTILMSINKCALNILLFLVACFTEDQQIWYHTLAKCTLIYGHEYISNLSVYNDPDDNGS